MPIFKFACSLEDPKKCDEKTLQWKSIIKSHATHRKTGIFAATASRASGGRQATFSAANKKTN